MHIERDIHSVFTLSSYTSYRHQNAIEKVLSLSNQQAPVTLGPIEILRRFRYFRLLSVILLQTI